MAKKTTTTKAAAQTVEETVETTAESQETTTVETLDTTTETKVPQDTTTTDTPVDPTDKPAETQEIVSDLKSGDIVSEETNPEGIKIEESEPVYEKIESVKDENVEEFTDSEIDTPDTITETEVTQGTTATDNSVEPTDTSVDPIPPSTEETETPDAGDTEPADKTPTDPVPPQDPVTEPVKEEKPAVALSSVYPVRYHITFSQKRMAFVRQMPIYNMLSTWCFNKSSFIGCTSKKDYEEIESCVKALPDDKVRVEGIMLSAAAKEQFLIKLKANTDYCVLKWGDKRK